MIFAEAQKARYDKFIHKGGDHGSDGELWNRHDLHIIIHKLMKENERHRAIGWRKGFADCQAMKRLTKRADDVCHVAAQRS